MKITHTRIEITTEHLVKACPYCKIRPLLTKTCGHPECQWKHRVLTLRSYPRKTGQIRMKRRTKKI